MLAMRPVHRAVFPLACPLCCKYDTHVCLLLAAVLYETAHPKSMYTNVVVLCAALKGSVLPFPSSAMLRCTASRNRFNA